MMKRMNNGKCNGKIKAILVDVIPLDASAEEERLRMNELENLVETFGGVVVIKKIQKRGVPEYSTYIGKGKVNELAEEGMEKGAELVVVNNLLKPRQIYNLNEKFKDAKMKAWDRVDLILKIFDKHAQSTEAKLQIQLASIKHMGPRIYNMGIELSRQAGAVGLRAGQGESNTEMMKRYLAKQEQSIRKKLKHYEVVHEGHRNRRRRRNLKTMAIVGYTNAGKSSLLNALTKKGAYVADQLFATLDTRVGNLYLPELRKEVLVSDTIGFIQDLPPELIEAFKSTLLEAIESDFLLHVIDITDEQIEMKIEVVEEILRQLGVGDKPKIYVFNKMDLVREEPELEEDEFDPEKRKEYPGILEAGKETSRILGWEKDDRGRLIANTSVLKKKYSEFTPVFVSANEKIGLPELIALIEKNLGK